MDLILASLRLTAQLSGSHVLPLKPRAIVWLAPHRVTVFQTLAHTLEWDHAQWRKLDDLHKLRNRFDYGDVVHIPEGHVETAVASAQALLDDVLRAFPTAKPGA